MGAKLYGVREEGWSTGGLCALWRVVEDGASSECWAGVGKSMSITGKISCNGGEDWVSNDWQNGKTLSWKVTSRLVKKVFASISNNLYLFYCEDNQWRCIVERTNQIFA